MKGELSQDDAETKWRHIKLKGLFVPSLLAVVEQKTLSGVHATERREAWAVLEKQDLK